MTLQLYNSDGQQLESFTPCQNNKVAMYCCGPTVYNYAHIGNLRAYMVQDILRRCLLALGYSLHHVMNITDVGHLTENGDDKMLLSARTHSKKVEDIANYYTEVFFQDCQSLRIARPDTVCRATDHITDMQNLITKIEAAGFTYYSNGNLYFDTSKLDHYGRLACLSQLAENQTISRTGPDNAKKNQRDFVLWFSNGKFSDQTMQWDSPWGRGYPGWHIECSAMASHFLGTKIDIHCGGVDHQNIHHSNEIAQSESILAPEQRPWVRFWVHNEFVLIKNKNSEDGMKISKSDGSPLTLQELQSQGYSPLDYRYFLLGSHYRSQIQFHFQALDGAQKSRKRLQQKVTELRTQCNRQPDLENASQTIAQIQSGKLKNSYPNNYIEEFFKTLLQDLNTPKALAYLWNIIKENKLSPQEKLIVLEFGESLLQIGLFEVDNNSKITPPKIPQQYLEMLAQRDQARKNKDYARADKLRAELQKSGYQIVDTPQGSQLTGLN